MYLSRSTYEARRLLDGDCRKEGSEENSMTQGFKLNVNIGEYQEIAMAVLSELYIGFPIHTVLDTNKIAEICKVEPDTTMSSGRPFADILEGTIEHLHAEGYIRPLEGSPRERPRACREQSERHGDCKWDRRQHRVSSLQIWRGRNHWQPDAHGHVDEIRDWRVISLPRLHLDTKP
jgi:hypothetical protein